MRSVRRLRRSSRMLERLVLICLVSSPLAAWAFYKPVRVLAPELAGVSCVSEFICSDDVSRHAEATVLYDEATATRCFKG